MSRKKLRTAVLFLVLAALMSGIAVVSALPAADDAAAEPGGTDWILFTAPVSEGSSGGPLLNGNGEVIGVVTGTYEKGQNLNLAAPIAAASALLG